MNCDILESDHDLDAKFEFKTPIQDLNRLHLLFETGHLSDVKPLELVVNLKRIEEALKVVRDGLLGAANREFMQLVADNPGKKEFQYGEATLKKYTSPGEYVWPKHVVKLDTELKAAKDAAKADGTAQKLEKEIDLEKNTTFSVSVKESMV